MIKKDQFIRMSITRNNGFRVIPDLGKRNSSYGALMNLKALKRLSQYLPFPCKFDERGYCQSSIINTSMCCCRDCVNTMGYLTFVPEQDLWQYAKLYNVKTGYWRKDKGCVLPRELRSKTCLTYYCETFDGRIGKDTAFGDELWAYDRALATVENEYKKQVNYYQNITNLKKEYSA